MMNRGKKKGEVDPNAVTQEARSGEQKASFYLKAVYKNQKQTNGDEKQSSNQERDKVAKQNQQDKVQIKNQSSTQNMENSKPKTYQTGQEHGANRKQWPDKEWGEHRD